jgi:alpha-tubulin suppressor-like RCC1 family protein
MNQNWAMVVPVSDRSLSNSETIWFLLYANTMASLRNFISYWLRCLGHLIYLLSLPLSLSFLIGCTNPLGGSETKVDSEFHPGAIPIVAPASIVASSISISVPSSTGSTLCSAAITLTALDATGLAVTITEALSISLSATGTASFYSDSLCTSVISTATISAESSSVVVYSKLSSPGTQTITASATGLSSAVATSYVVGATAVSNGYYHSCALLNDGRVKCWGNNAQYQLGDGTTDSHSTAVTVSGVTSATAISTGKEHSCALISGGTVKCWGKNSSGMLGIGNTSTQILPVTVSGISTASAISTSASGYHTCALLSDSTAKCWGYNGTGALGNGNTTSQPSPIDTGFTNIISIFAGDSHTCLVLSDGTMRCAGSNGSGQLGNGSTTASTTWVTVSGINTAVKTYGGIGTSCAVLGSGTLSCWGSNGYGALGDGSSTNRTTAVTITPGGVGTIVKRAGAISTSCVLLSSKTIRCSGSNRQGELVGFTVITSSTMTAINGVSDVADFDMGYQNVCAVLADGTVSCWGSNTTGQLGNGIVGGKYSPTQVTGLLAAKTPQEVGVGNYHTCVTYTDGTGSCAGWDQASQLGRGGAVQNAQSHVAVSGLANAAGISSSGSIHTCAAITGGAVNCWGYNLNGQIGDSSNTSRHFATAVTGITTASKVVGGTSHSCALLTGGSVKCWGLGTSGQLGDGNSTSSNTPVSVTGIASATDIAAGANHTCALLTGGSIKCWGAGSNGQLGQGANTASATPVAVSGIATATAVGAGFSHTCAVLTGGSISCWGYNSSGQLGNNSLTNTNTPVAVSSISNGSSVVGSQYSTCALLTDKTVSCWGDNQWGQLASGIASTNTVKIPGLIANFGDVNKIYGGANAATSFCAIKTDNSVWCWGNNDVSQMGLGNDPDFSIQSVNATQLFN